MQDAAEVVDALKSVVAGTRSLKEAIHDYEEGMRLRGARDVALSLETASKLLVSELKESPMFKVGLKKTDSQSAALDPDRVQLLD